MNYVSLDFNRIKVLREEMGTGFDGERFWVDPREELTCVFMTQFMPSSFYPIRRELKAVIYQALR